MKKSIVVVFILMVVTVGLLLDEYKKTFTIKPDLKEKLSKCEQLMIEGNRKDIVKYEGEPKPVDFSTLPQAKLFYTSITETVEKGPNFAGHFTVAYWGCGTDCFGYAVVDVNTGEIIAYSSANGNYHLRANYSLNDYYLILDPVYASEERKYYSIAVDEDNVSHLELVCSERAEEDMYGLPE